MRTAPLAAALIAIGLITPSLSAADTDGGSFTDLRLVGSLLDKNYDYRASGNTSGPLAADLSDDGDDKWDEAWRAGIVAQNLNLVGDGPIGFSSGIGIFYDRFEQDDDDGNSHSLFEALSAQLRLGVGFSVGDVLHIEVLPFGGLGGARGEIGDVDSGDVDLYWEYGIEAGAYVTLARSFQIGVHGGWMKSGFDMEFDDESEFQGVPVENVKLKIRNEGPYIGASIGGRF